MLTRSKLLIKEHVGLLKLKDTFDIFDPETGEKLGYAHEAISGLAQLLRLFINKRMLPTTVEIKPSEDEPPILTIRRGFTLFQSKISVVNGDGHEIGFFKSKVFSLGGGFHIYDQNGTKVAEVKGDWKGWNFRLVGADGSEMGIVTKKWGGLGKEMFTSADTYIIALHENHIGNSGVVALLLAAGLAIDMVFKERD